MIGYLDWLLGLVYLVFWVGGWVGSYLGGDRKGVGGEVRKAEWLMSDE